MLVNAKDRGRLWKVNNDAQNTLSINVYTWNKEFRFQIKWSKIIFWDCPGHQMRSYYDNLCQNAKSLVDGETSASLLEQILGLIIRVWSHSHARDVKEQHKAKINEIKMHALRAELKKII